MESLIRRGSRSLSGESISTPYETAIPALAAVELDEAGLRASCTPGGTGIRLVVGEFRRPRVLVLTKLTFLQRPGRLSTVIRKIRQMIDERACRDPQTRHPNPGTVGLRERLVSAHRCRRIMIRKRAQRPRSGTSGKNAMYSEFTPQHNEGALSFSRNVRSDDGPTR